MNEWFFGDKRDLVKWSVLLRLAEKYKISIVFQICFRTECNWPTISFDGEPGTVDIHENVKKHFRSLQSVEQMAHRPLVKDRGVTPTHFTFGLDECGGCGILTCVGDLLV